MPSTNNLKTSCLVIGGGISGLMAAALLQRNNIRVTVLDKGRGIGGRLATRRLHHPLYGTGIFDYGAQFFTVSDPIFQQWVDQWLKQGVVKEWSKRIDNTEKPCYCGIDSNRALARHLAQDLEVHRQTRVTKIIWDNSCWRVETETGINFSADGLLMTPPIPQSFALLEDSGIIVPSSIKSRLEQVLYYPCISILALLSNPSLVPEPGWLRLNNASLASLACNHRRGISPHGFALTMYSTPEFSQAHWKTEDAIVAEKLFNLAASWLGATVVDYQVHRWRYSHPKTVYGDLFLPFQQPGLLLIAGDAFSTMPPLALSLTLEKAALSGLAAANYLLAQLTS